MISSSDNNTNSDPLLLLTSVTAIMFGFLFNVFKSKFNSVLLFTRLSAFVYKILSLSFVLPTSVSST